MKNYKSMSELLQDYPPPKTHKELDEFYYKIPNAYLLEIGDIVVDRPGNILQNEVVWSIAGHQAEKYNYFSFYRKRKITPRGNKILTYDVPVLHGW